MKRFVLAIALACVLSGSALAGDVQTPGAPAPPPPPGDMGNGAAPAPGDMGNGIDGDQGNGGAAVLLTILDLVF